MAVETSQFKQGSFNELFTFEAKKKPFPEGPHIYEPRIINTEGAKRGDVLVWEEELHEQEKKLGRELAKNYWNKGLVVLGLLDGALIPTANILRHTAHFMKQDFGVENMVHFNMLNVSSYDGTESTGQLRGDMNLKDRTKDYIKRGVPIVILDDIVDTGRTVNFLADKLRTEFETDPNNPLSIETMAIFDKPDKRAEEYKNFKPNYVGFELTKPVWLEGGLMFDTYGNGRLNSNVVVGPTEFTGIHQLPEEANF